MPTIEQPLTGATVVITGASSGIGLATARLIAARGAAVVLGSRRTDRIDAAARSIRDDGGHAIAVPTDVSVHADMQTLIDTGVREFGTVDAFVSNAGVARLGRLEALDAQDWAAMIDVNVHGLLHGLAVILPVFRRQGWGHVITTVSTAGLTATPTMGVYAATKNAQRTIMDALRVESSDGVIRTTEISPGFVRTELADGMDSESRESIRNSMQQFGLDPEAVARAICFTLEQPRDVEIGSLVIRPTAQG